jgi:hypothetical protein
VGKLQCEDDNVAAGCIKGGEFDQQLGVSHLLGKIVICRQREAVGLYSMTVGQWMARVGRCVTSSCQFGRPSVRAAAFKRKLIDLEDHVILGMS